MRNSIFSKRLTRRGFVRAGIQFLGGGMAMGVGGYNWAREVEPDWIQITQHELTLPDLARAFDGFRLVQLSDIHIESPAMRRGLAQVSKMVAALAPDAICITGDCFTRPVNPASARDLKTGLAPLGGKNLWAVLGNHDAGHGNSWANASQNAIENAGATVLRNQTHIFRRGADSLFLAGTDDLWHGEPDVLGLANAIPRGAPAILLVHEPDFALETKGTERFGLVLSGHSHGGQICAPFGRVLHTVPGAQRFTRGRYEFEGQTLYVHRGLGTVGPALRLFCRPEIAVFTLRPENRKGTN